MANDGSIVAQVETWMVAAITAADSGGLFDLVDHFDGVRSEAAKIIVEEIFQHRDRAALVYCTGGLARDLSANDQYIGTEYQVLIAVKNARGKAGRIGESAGKPGIHLLREIVQAALHGQHTGAVNARLGSEVCRYQRFETVVEQATGWIVALTFAVAEVPPA